MGDENENTPAAEETILENPDVKPDAPASSAEDGVTPDSPPEAPTMLDVAQKVVDEHEADDDESDGSPKATTSPEGDVDDEEEEDASAMDPKDAALPFAKHKRFQEVLAKARERDGLEAKVKEVEPLAQAWQQHADFIQKHGISDAEVATVMNALAYSKVDPAKARELLRPLYDSFGQLDPNQLPQDLLDQVKEGEITEAMAKRLWKAECATKVAAQTGQHLAMSQKQLVRKAINDTVVAWEARTKAANPDFKPSKDATKPGLLELTQAFYTRDLAAAIGGGQIETPQLHQQLMDAALAAAKGVMRRSPAPTKKLPNSRMSSGSQRSNKPVTDDDNIAAVAAKYGYKFSRNGNDED